MTGHQGDSAMKKTMTPERKTIMRTTLAGLSAIILTLALAPAAMAQSAPAEQVSQYKPAAVFVVTDAANDTVPPEMYFDGVILGDLLDIPYSAYTAGPNGRAWAAASLEQFDAGALGGGSAEAGAGARAMLEFVIPGEIGQLVRVNIGSKLGSTANKGFKGAMSTTAPLNPVWPNGGYLQIKVYPSPEVYPQITLEGDRVIDVEYPDVQPGGIEYTYQLFAQIQTWWDAVDGVPVLKSHWGYYSFLNGTTVGDFGEGDGMSMSFQVFPSIVVLRGVRYIVDIEAGAGPNSLSVIDPVVEPHPDNPDIVIEFPNAATDPNPSPIMRDLTAEQIEALGIDPQPFIDIGFIEESTPPPPTGDTTPPITVASATPKLNTKSGNKTPVTVTMTATDNGGGSGVKEVHYSLEGATTGSQVVSGGSAAVTLSAAGTTTLTYFAVDNDGNEETAQTLTVRIKPHGR
jgi:hypothetical protein